MTEQELKNKLLELLTRVAPEVDPATVDATEPIQQALDIDSYDYLNLLVSIRDELGVTIDEADYDNVRTLDDLVHFLLPKVSNSS